MIAGHSAGGHLALWASTRFSGTAIPEAGSAVNIDRTIGLAAISDLVTYAGGESPCEVATVSLLDGTPQQYPERYQEASPLLLSVNPETMVIHGTDDRIVPVNQSKQFSRTTGAQCIEVTNAGHFDLVNPESIAWPYLSEALTRP